MKWGEKWDAGKCCLDLHLILKYNIDILSGYDMDGKAHSAHTKKNNNQTCQSGPPVGVHTSAGQPGYIEGVHIYGKMSSGVRKHQQC